jgi:hypothetical protein
VAQDAETADFPLTPEGWGDRWKKEIDAATKAMAKSRSAGELALQWYLDGPDTDRQGDSHWNLFSVNVQVQKALTYGQTPKTMVTRRFGDADDDAGRVAGVMLERTMNNDIERDSDTSAKAWGCALDDFLVTAIGQVRLRLVQEKKTEKVPPIEARPGVPPELGPDGQPVPAAEGYDKEVLVREDVEVDYVYWPHFLYSPARVWQDVRWVDFIVELSTEKFTEMFGPEAAQQVASALTREKPGPDSDVKKADPWRRYLVHEIWDKEHKKVFFYCEGATAVLKRIDIPGASEEDHSFADPLQLDGFFPCPEPCIDNTTNSAYLPRPGFAFVQDMYKDLDLVSSRIQQLVESVKVLGFYNQEMGELKDLMTAKHGSMVGIPWPQFAEKGGITQNIAWLPLDQIVATLDKLRDVRQELIDGIYQMEGLGDIMRGQAAETGVTATEQSLKAKFGSVRMRAKQMRFAKFVSDTQRLKGEMISRHFAPQTIIERSNIERTPDAEHAQEAVALLKSDFACYRIEVKPEAVSLSDSAALKQQRTEFISALSGFFTAVAPIGAQSPAAVPFLLRIAQWAVAPLEGASTIEGHFDKMIAEAEKAAQAPKPPPEADPAAQAKLLELQIKGQQDKEKADRDLAADAQRAEIEVEADRQREWNQAQANNWERQQQDQRMTTRESMREATEPAPDGGSP